MTRDMMFAFTELLISACCASTRESQVANLSFHPSHSSMVTSHCRRHASGRWLSKGLIERTPGRRHPHEQPWRLTRCTGKPEPVRSER
eukprot:6179075-Pyramimonas_sp.AAC.1